MARVRTTAARRSSKACSCAAGTRSASPSAHPTARSSRTQEPLNSVLHRNRFARAPFFRGIVVLYETLVIGTRWLMRSGSVQAAAGEGVGMGRGAIAVTFDLHASALAIGLFVLLPLFLAQAATNAAIRGRPGLVAAPGRGPDPRRDLRRLPAGRQPLQRDPARLPVPRRRAHDHPRARARRPADDRARPPATPPRTRAAAPSSWSSSSS